MRDEHSGGKLATDEEFSTALEVSRQLHQSGYFEIRPMVASVEITVEDDRAREALAGTDLSPERYRAIVDRELDLLLTAGVLGMNEEALLEAPPLEGIDEDGQAVVLARANTVREAFPIEQLNKEVHAKRASTVPALRRIDWQTLGPAPVQAEKQAPAAAVRLTMGSSHGYGVSAGTPSLAALLGLSDAAASSFMLTASDVRYLLRHFGAILEHLDSEEGT